MVATICEKCSKEVRPAKRGSLTQWIFDDTSCSCHKIPPQLSADKTNNNVCPKCFNLKSSRRSGSMTQWIFRRYQCQCDPESQTETPLLESSSRDLDFIGEPHPEESFTDLYLPFNVERYKPLNVIAKSLNSVVYKCFDRELGRIVAIKTLMFADSAQLIRFQQEARATGNLKHSNIVEVLDFGIGDGGSAYMVLEFVEATTLEDLLSRNGPISEAETISMVTGVCRALDFAHGKGIFHRDLKPQNVLIAHNKAVKLIDFGLAFVRQEQTPYNTEGLSLAGTPMYMSPDQFLGRPYDARSEIYSLGCVLFACLTGRPPYEGTSPMELARKHTEAPIPNLQEVSPEIRCSSRLQQAISRCLAKDSDMRFSTVAELANDLQIDISGLHQEQVHADNDFADGAHSIDFDGDGKNSASVHSRTSAINRDTTENTAQAGIIICALAVILFFGATAFLLQPQQSPVEKKAPPPKIKINETLAVAPSILLNVIDDPWITGLDPEHRDAELGVTDADFKRLAADKNRDKIKVVVVANSEINGTGVQYLKGMKIESLKLVSKDLSDEGMGYLRVLPKLRDLQIGSAGKLTLGGYRKIAGTPQINSVKLLNMPVLAGSLSVLAKKANLAALNLRNDRVEPRFHADYKPIASMHNLNYLEIRGFDFNNNDLRLLSNLKGLCRLFLINLELNDANLEVLQTLPMLYEVNLSQTKITDAGLQKLGAIKSMTILTVIDCPNLTAAGLRAFQKQHPHVSLQSTSGEDESVTNSDIAKQWIDRKTNVQ